MIHGVMMVKVTLERKNIVYAWQVDVCHHVRFLPAECHMLLHTCQENPEGPLQAWSLRPTTYILLASSYRPAPVAEID
jgi:hypothetical protein